MDFCGASKKKQLPKGEMAQMPSAAERSGKMRTFLATGSGSMNINYYCL